MTLRPLTLIAVLMLVAACAHRPHCERRACFPDVGAATEAGVLDPRIAASIRQTGRANALLLLEIEPMRVQYREDVRPAHLRSLALEQFKTELRRIQDDVRSLLPTLEVFRRYDALPLIYATLVDGTDILKLLNSGFVAAIAADRLNDFLSTANLGLIRADIARGWGETGAGVGVAIVDSGVNFSLPAFGSCTTPGPTCGVRFAEDFAPDDGQADSSPDQHGTFTAAIVRTVAPDAHILALDVGNAQDKIWDSDGVRALNWVINNHFKFNIRAANLSYGMEEHWTTPCSALFQFFRNPYQAAFGTMRQLGVLPIVASGNWATSNGTFTDGVSFPACTPGAVVVGAVYDANVGATAFPPCGDAASAADQPTCFSQSGSLLTLLAPGEQISAAGMVATGTSSAAPHVAGAVAILAAYDPLASPDEIERALTSSGHMVVDSRNSMAKPRLDIAAALQARTTMPTNDNFSNAMILSGIQSVVQQVTWIATKEAGEPAHAAGNAGGGSLWYRWRAPFSGTAKVQSTGSNFDTLLGVYTGSGVGSLARVADNDDQSPTDRTSAVSFTTVLNTDYWIAVDGKRITGVTGRGKAIVAVNAPISNDAIASAESLTWQVPANGSNVGASKEAGEGDHCGNQGGASVWYQWRATTNGSVSVRTSSPSFSNRCVSVYRSAGAPLNASSLVHVAGGLWATPDDTWSAHFSATANDIYYIAVEGMSSEEPGFDAPATGQFTITVQP